MYMQNKCCKHCKYIYKITKQKPQSICLKNNLSISKHKRINIQ